MPFFHQAEVRPNRTAVYQLKTTVACSDGVNAAIDHLAGLIFPFASKSTGFEIPSGEQILKGFREEDPDRQAEWDIFCMPARGIWATHFTFQGRFNDTDLLWEYEIALASKDNGLIFGIRVWTDSTINVKELQKDLPFIDTLIEEGGLMIMRPVKDNLWDIATPEDVDRLLELLLLPGRSLPVIVISAVNRNQWTLSETAPDFLVDAEYLASQVKGYAIIVRLGYQASYELTNAIGRSWAVFDGACRYYLPYVDLANGNPCVHRCNFKGEIWNWKFNDKSGPEVYTDFLIDSAHYWLPRGQVNWRDLFFTQDANLVNAEIELERAPQMAPTVPMGRESAMERTISALRKRLAIAEEENASLLRELDGSNGIHENSRRELAALRAQLDELRQRLARETKSFVDDDIPIPENSREMGEWTMRYLVGRLVMLPKTERVATRLEDVDVDQVYDALLILANEFRDFKLGRATEQIFHEVLADSNIHLVHAEESQVGISTSMNIGEFRESTRTLKGDYLECGRESSFSNVVRLYYFWDPRTRQVFVTWIGTFPKE